MKQQKDVENENEKTNKKLQQIEKVGGALLGASVLTGFFGMNSGYVDKIPDDITVIILVVTIVIGFIYVFKKENHE